MNNSPTILGNNIILRKPIDSDALDYLACGRNPELVRMYGGDTRNLRPLTPEEANHFIQKILKNELEWCAEYNGRCIGQARLTVNQADCRARYAVGIFDSSVWGIGLGTEITQLVLHYAFEKLNLHRVDLKVLEYNHRAIACYEKCGSIKEGTEREGALIEGRYETDIIMSILDREYELVKNSFSEVPFFDF